MRTTRASSTLCSKCAAHRPPLTAPSSPAAVPVRAHCAALRDAAPISAAAACASAPHGRLASSHRPVRWHRQHGAGAPVGLGLAEQIYPRIRDTMQTHTMIFIPHYFESDGPAPLRPMLSVVFMSPRRGCPSVGASSCVPWTRAHTRLHSPSHSLNARSAALHCGGCAPITAVHARGAGAAQAAQSCFVMLASIHRRVYAMRMLYALCRAS